MQLEPILQYLGDYLDVEDHPDYKTSLNGLQVAAPAEVEHVVAAVDASEASVLAAVERGADLLLVHHGLYFDGLKPLTGRRYRRIAPLILNQVGLYSVHLPLDSHGEVGNCALLGRALGLDLQGRFADFQGADIGWWGTLSEPLGAADLQERLSSVLDGGPVHLIPGGPEEITRVGVVTGGGGAFTEEAAGRGLDALVTGEGTHHTHFQAMESGIHVLMGGHYATEVFGVQALASHLAERFDLTWEFVDQPTGL